MNIKNNKTGTHTTADKDTSAKLTRLLIRITLVSITLWPSIFGMRDVTNIELFKKVDAIVAKNANDGQYSFHMVQYSPHGAYLVLLTAKDRKPSSESQIQKILDHVQNLTWNNVKEIFLSTIQSLTSNNFQFQLLSLWNKQGARDIITSIELLQNFLFTITVFDAKTGEETLNVATLSSPVFMFSKDESLFAYEDEIYHFKTKNKIPSLESIDETLKGLSDQKYCFNTWEFSQKNNYAIRFNFINNQIELFDIKKRITPESDPAGTPTDSDSDSGYDSDSEKNTTESHQNLKEEIGFVLFLKGLYDMDNAGPIYILNNKLNKYTIQDYAISPSETYIAIRTDKNKLKLFNIKTHKRKKLEIPNVQTSNYEFSQNDKYICVHFARKGGLKLYNIKTQEEILHIPSEITGYYLNPDNTHIVTRDTHNSVKLYNHGEEKLQIKNVFNYKFIYKGKYLYIITKNEKTKTLMLFDITNNYKTVLTKNLSENEYAFLPNPSLPFILFYTRNCQIYLEHALDIDTLAHSYPIGIGNLNHFSAISDKAIKIKIESKDELISQERILELPNKDIKRFHNKLSSNKAYRDLKIFCSEQ